MGAKGGTGREALKHTQPRRGLWREQETHIISMT